MHSLNVSVQEYVLTKAMKITIAVVIKIISLLGNSLATRNKFILMRELLPVNKLLSIIDLRKDMLET